MFVIPSKDPWAVGEIAQYNQEIAEALNITRGTARWHVNIILRRLDVSDRTQAVVIAAQRGISEIWFFRLSISLPSPRTRVWRLSVGR
jgi:hypothetical protein